MGLFIAFSVRSLDEVVDADWTLDEWPLDDKAEDCCPFEVIEV